MAEGIRLRKETWKKTTNLDNLDDYYEIIRKKESDSGDSLLLHHYRIEHQGVEDETVGDLGRGDQTVHL